MEYGIPECEDRGIKHSQENNIFPQRYYTILNQCRINEAIVKRKWPLI